MKCCHCGDAEATHYVTCHRTIYEECDDCYKSHNILYQKELTPDEVTIYLTERLLQ